MTDYPLLAPSELGPTLASLHAYAREVGSWLKSCRPKRKHWWHASLRPSLHGLTTGVVHGAIDFELELNLRGSTLDMRAANGAHHSERLAGQPARELALSVERFLVGAGIDEASLPEIIDQDATDVRADYSDRQASLIADALARVSSALDDFRAGIPEETSPIQLWPHHFDLSMIWLPGEKIPGQDPDDEEYADKQMNFGFVFGDSSVEEPYFYVSAYPFPQSLSGTQLPEGARWNEAGFEGALVHYAHVAAQPDPKAYLLGLWSVMLTGGRRHLLKNND